MPKYFIPAQLQLQLRNARHDTLSRVTHHKCRVYTVSDEIAVYMTFLRMAPRGLSSGRDRGKGANEHQCKGRFHVELQLWASQTEGHKR
jgi:hypothetical protein